MESVIRGGALRLLANESSCDVVLSCQGHRIMAHKLILAMASPVFRALLLDDLSDSTLIILPDISGTIMSLILDYIYTGSAVVYSNTSKDFLSLASLLRIHLDVESNRLLNKNNIFCDIAVTDEKFDKNFINKKMEIPLEDSTGNGEIYSKKNQKKMPELLHIKKFLSQEETKVQRRLCSYLMPSPWCPRVERIFGDPRGDHLEVLTSQFSPTKHSNKNQQSDSNNNNFQISTFSNHSYIKNNVNQNPNNSYNTTSEKYVELEKQPQTHTVFPFNKHSFKKFKIAMRNGIFSNVVDSSDLVEASSQGKDLISCDYNIKVSSNETSTKDTLLVSNLIQKVEPLDFKGPNLDGLKHEDGPLTRLLSTNENRKDRFVNYSYDNDANDEESCVRTVIGQKTRKNKPYKCEDCGKSFSQLRNYKYHRSVHEGTKEFAAKCIECGKVFNDKGYLSSHMKIHRDEKEYACPHCPKRFNQRVAYNMHLRIHTGIKPHDCLICGKSFSRKMLLKQHHRVHTGERPYSCPECGKTFADRSNMSLHARLHTGVKPYACSMCSKSFTKKHHLKTHMNFHTGLKPYTCEKCGLAFSQSSNMRTHFKKCILRNSESDCEGKSEDS